MREPQQPGGKLTLEFRMEFTRAAEAALLTNHESHSGLHNVVVTKPSEYSGVCQFPVKTSTYERQLFNNHNCSKTLEQKDK